MSDQIAAKRDKFSSFFLIKHAIPINITPLDKAVAEQDMLSFEAKMPYAFKIATELSEIEAQALRPFRNLGEKFEELVEYLQLQARKMDLMMSYILQQQDDPQYRMTADKFGGGGVSVKSSELVEIGSAVEIKLFLEDEAAAVYCLGEAIKCEASNEGFMTDYYFTHIRDEDQELLVRATLHLQTKQLRKDKNS